MANADQSLSDSGSPPKRPAITVHQASTGSLACPGGNSKLLVGGGTKCEQTGGFISGSTPLKDRVTWKSGCNGSSSVTATVAVCIDNGPSYQLKEPVGFGFDKGPVQWTCLNNSVLVGGGCYCEGQAVVESYPISSTAWRCNCDGSTVMNGFVAWAICMPPGEAAKIGLIAPATGPKTTNTSTASCGKNYVRISGGCSSDVDLQSSNTAQGQESWSCSGPPGSKVQAHVICAGPYP